MYDFTDFVFIKINTKYKNVCFVLFYFLEDLHAFIVALNLEQDGSEEEQDEQPFVQDTCFWLVFISVKCFLHFVLSE